MTTSCAAETDLYWPRAWTRDEAVAEPHLILATSRNTNVTTGLTKPPGTHIHIQSNVGVGLSLVVHLQFEDSLQWWSGIGPVLSIRSGDVLDLLYL